MQQWMRFEHAGKTKIGTVHRGEISVCQGDMFNAASPTGERLPLGAVRCLTPCDPSKMIALWNNFHALAAKLQLPAPAEPLYLVKTSNCYHPCGEPIRRPASYSGKVAFEGELGIVLGKTCKEVCEDDAHGYIFGYTCINDVTAVELINKEANFQQWVRAKSFDTFGVFGPTIAAGLNPAELTVRTLLDGEERQNYPLNDMVFSPARLVSRISHDMTLYPGDVIACGTSVGVGSMKPGAKVEVIIDGIGTLANVFA